MRTILLPIILFFLITGPQSAFSQSIKEHTKFADSLFRTENFEEARNVYEKIFYSHHTYSPSLLLKMAFLEEYNGNIPGAMYFLSIYNKHHPDKQVRGKIQTLAAQFKLEGYEFQEWAYLIFLLKKYKPILAFVVSIILTFYAFHLFLKKRKKTPLGARPSLMFIAIILLFYLFNFKVDGTSAISSNGPSAIMAGPSAASRLIGFLPDGSKIKITGESDIWYEIKYKGENVFIRKNQAMILL